MDRTILAKFAFWGLLTAVLLALLLGARSAPPALGAAAAACTEGATDGGFESEGQGWIQQVSPALPAGATLITSFYPYSGKLGADLAGRVNANDRLSQQVTFPANATSISLSFWWSSVTQETASSTAFDHLRVALYQPDGVTVIATLLTAHNATSEDWLWNFSHLDLGQYVGQTVLLRFTATNDATNPTEFFVDDVSIQSCAAEPASTATATATRTITPTVTPTAKLTATPTPTQGIPPSRQPSFLPLLLHGKQ